MPSWPTSSLWPGSGPRAGRWGRRRRRSHLAGLEEEEGENQLAVGSLSPTNEHLLRRQDKPHH